MNEIIARSLKLFQKDGKVISYTHVTSIRNDDNNFYISGETDDIANGRIRVVDDPFPIRDINVMIMEPYKPVK